MSKPRVRPPYLLLAVAALAIGATVWFVFFRGKPTDTVSVVASEPPKALPADPGRDRPAPGKETKVLALRESAPGRRHEPDLLERLRELTGERKWREARALVARSFGSDMSDSDRRAVAEISIDVQRRLLEGSDPADVGIYTVGAGDSLWKIAKRFKALHGSYGPILLANRMNSPRSLLRMGQKLRIPVGAWSIVVDKSLFTLWLCYEGAPYRKFTVGIGKEERTPSGEFTVGDKTPKPAWYPPHDIILELRKKNAPIPVPYAHAENPLGEYWIALRHESFNGLGIHGNNDPPSLGTKSSLGCIRMDNKEVMMIAWTAYPGMRVTIRE